ncbi:DUF2147 domain-containing protein [Bradyrhizobium sp. SYSU BS000235]|uniref:DUF2147 domain-containing protein n=1 Tax=Bradyrhizobium sp. SYSU BS000235 TaxID=3411332 RepID=UPI003C718384
MTSKLNLILALLFFTCAFSTVKAEEEVPAGVWLTEKGDARIQISQCGNTLCGKVVWLREPIDPATGKPQTDSKNPNASLSSRPMIGVQLFVGMRPSGPGTWTGRIYNADDGGMYDSKIAWTGPNSLRVEGCVGAICGGENWRKVGSR